MNILYIIPSFFPAVHFGGPIFTSLGLCRGVAGTAGINLKVLTTDAAGPNDRKRTGLQAISNINFPYEIQYCRRIAGSSISLELLQRLKRKIQWAHVVHLSAVYSFPTLPTLWISHLLNKPVVWSPRGALQQWKASSNSGLKKIWVRLCDIVWDPNLCCLHYTSKAEKLESQKILGHLCSDVIPNGVDIPDIVCNKSAVYDRVLKLMFIGRIHKKKGLENLITAVAALTHVDCTLDIYGTGEESYQNSLKNLCLRLGVENLVRFRGHVDGEQKTKAYLSAHTCIVPSHSENFGNVVAEALACGIPVIAGKGTPWSMLEQQGCGIWTPNDPGALAGAIAKISAMDLRTMGLKGRQWMQRDFSWETITPRMLALYERMRRTAG
jgi:glycosyltransferase involved in cell wall biosynthesis